MALHGRMYIEQGAVGIKDNGAGVGEEVRRGHDSLLEEWD
jgi:hypothetical protein